MPRYVVRTNRPRSLWVEDDHDMPDLRSDPLPMVSEHVAVNSGLLDQHGNTIWREPDPIGFRIGDGGSEV
jgi:hypothetical protein